MASSSLAGGLRLAALLTAVLCLQLPAASRAQLQVGFYSATCPNAETIVRREVTAAFANNSGVAAGLIRLHFHDCFVNHAPTPPVLRASEPSVLRALEPCPQRSPSVLRASEPQRSPSVPHLAADPAVGAADPAVGAPDPAAGAADPAAGAADPAAGAPDPAARAPDPAAGAIPCPKSRRRRHPLPQIPPPGCDASVLLSVNPGGGTAERDEAPNNPSLRGFEVVNAARAALEQSCPRTVSCADILAFAARDSVNITGSNVFYQVPAGRRDGSVSNGTLAFTLPGPDLTALELVKGFEDRNLTAEEMVVLSGAHTLGRSHCNSFIVRNRERLANGTISPAYQALLEALCPANTSQFTPVTTEIDLSTPTVLDNNYYKLLPLNLGLHFSDDQLIRNGTLKASVDAFAANETLWKEKFVAAMIKMGRIQPKTGAEGEIRLNCSLVNTRSSASAGAVIEMLRPGSDDGVATS